MSANSMPNNNSNTTMRKRPSVYELISFPLPFDAIATECGYGLTWANFPDLLKCHSFMDDDELGDPINQAALKDVENWFARQEP